MDQNELPRRHFDRIGFSRMGGRALANLFWLFLVPLFVACQPADASVPVAVPTAESSVDPTVAKSPSKLDDGLAPSQKPSGKLILIDESPFPDHKLYLYDLESQIGETVFEAPLNSWIFQVDVSADGNQMALAYAAPPAADLDSQDDRVPFDRNGIYLSQLDDGGLMSEPVLLFGETAANEFVFNPTWTADGKSIFYVSYKRIPADEVLETWKPSLEVALMRYDLESAEHVLISKDGIWPRLSPDGEKLVFIQVDPISTQRSIRVSDLDGENVTELVPFNQFFDIDSPHFSADGQSVYFGAVPHSTKVERTLWEIVLGVQVASAHVDHNLPSNWWHVSLDGGDPEKLSDVRRIISYGGFDDVGENLFYATDVGVYQMAADGDSDQRLPIQNSYRYFVWLP